MIRCICPRPSNNGIHAANIHDAPPRAGLVQLGGGGLAAEEDGRARDAHHFLKLGERVVLNLDARAVDPGWWVEGQRSAGGTGGGWRGTNRC